MNIKARRGLSTGMIVGGVIGLVIVVVVASALMGTIVTNVNSLTTGASPLLSGSAGSLYSLIPLFVALGILVVAIVFGVDYIQKHLKAYRYNPTIPGMGGFISAIESSESTELSIPNY